ncbi:DUF6188 family protein [Naumannella halotolerans]|uniref:Uncharacterized protein n=1 Tax=Naumannella halotolerans TaxID=993414 RepID=A0A4R7J421_9ACTN|nr:DUF6188 family protein [Naumannella halotolerans]TDT31306.1 hypothetical protein CLV29_2722 [Naumannella halotolerans]
MIDLGISGLVASFTAEYSLAFELIGGVAIRIETECVVAGTGVQAATLDVGSGGLEEKWRVFFSRREVERVCVDRDFGSLMMEFDSGWILKVLPSGDFEAWMVAWPDSAVLVALPGGGTSYWSA